MVVSLALPLLAPSNGRYVLTGLEIASYRHPGERRAKKLAQAGSPASPQGLHIPENMGVSGRRPASPLLAQNSASRGNPVIGVLSLGEPTEGKVGRARGGPRNPWLPGSALASSWQRQQDTASHLGPLPAPCAPSRCFPLCPTWETWEALPQKTGSLSSFPAEPRAVLFLAAGSGLLGRASGDSTAPGALSLDVGPRALTV